MRKRTLNPLPRSRGSREYIITIGDTDYGSDEIQPSPTLDINGGGDGYSVGNVVVSTFNATVLLKGNMPQRNALVYLTYKDSDSCKKVGPWYIHDRSLKDGMLTFSADDILGFADNAYDQPPDDYTDTDGVTHQYSRTAKTHMDLIIAKLSEYGGAVGAEPISDKVEPIDLPPSNGMSMREALGYIAAANGSNCYADLTALGGAKVAMRPPGYKTITLTDDDHDSISVGSRGLGIEQIIVSKNGSETPALSGNETLEDYGILQHPVGTYKCSRVLSLTNPMIPNATSYGKPHDIGDIPLWDCLAADFGTAFSCSTAQVNEIYPYFSKVGFGGRSETFYATGMSYRFTASGIFLSLSGSGKAEADSDFMGTTEGRLNKKLTVGSEYGSLKISANGTIRSKGAGYTTEFAGGRFRAIFEEESNGDT